MKQIEFYQNAVEGLGHEINEDNVICRPGKKPTPIKVDGHPLVLPVDKYLDENDWSEVYPFHPLCENIIMGQSPSIHFMSRALMQTISVCYGTLVTAILKIASDEEAQKTLVDSNALELLELVPKAKPDWANKANAVAKAIASGWQTDDGSKESLLGKLYISREGKIDDERFLRIATLDFPILEQANPDKFCGVPMQKAPRKAIYTLYSHLLGDIKREFGSNDTNPYSHAFFQAARELIKKYNNTAKLLGKNRLPKLNDKWFKMVDKLDELTSEIPELATNAGVRLKQKDEVGSGKTGIDFDILDDDGDISTSTSRTSKRDDSRDDERRTRSDRRRDEEDDDRRSRRDRGRSRDRYDDEDDRRSSRRTRSDRRRDDDDRDRGRRTMRDSLRSRGGRRDDDRRGSRRRDRDDDRRGSRSGGRTMRDMLRR